MAHIDRPIEICSKNQSLLFALSEFTGKSVDALMADYLESQVVEGNLSIDVAGFSVAAIDGDTILICVDDWEKVVSHQKSGSFAENILRILKPNEKRFKITLATKSEFPELFQAAIMGEIQVSGNTDCLILTDPETGASKSLSRLNGIAISMKVSQVLNRSVFDGMAGLLRKTNRNNKQKGV